MKSCEKAQGLACRTAKVVGYSLRLGSLRGDDADVSDIVAFLE
jgi:hypothetical protein